MAKRRVLKFLLWLFAAPLSVISILLERVSARFQSDIERCIELTRRFGNSVPAVFINAVILAEDHRNELHPGVDVLAMARAAWVRARSGQVQGASTIEQQFVRVVTGRQERTISRKVREQILALMLVRRIPKRQIASAYLAIAFFGSGLVGLQGLRMSFGDNLENVSFSQALAMVAQLKYPCPQKSSDEWYSKLEARIDALHILGVATANKSLQRTFEPQPILLPQNGPRLKRR